MELLSLIPIIGFALAWQRLRKTTAASAMLNTVSALMLMLLAASLVGALLPAAILSMAIGGLLAIAELGRHIRHRIPLPVPIGMFALLCAAYWMVQSGSSLYYYDEYSHWGIFLKEILAGHQLWGADTNSMHPRYLPGTSLWQYFFAVFSKNMEGAAYLAQFALLLTPLLVLWEKTGWERPLWLFAILVLVTITVSNFGHGFTSLYVDHLLGAWFAGVLLNLLFELEERPAVSAWAYVLPLAAIVLIKSTGVFFALAAAGIITVLLVARRNPVAIAARSSRPLLQAALFPVATLITCVAIVSIWNLNRDAAGLGTDQTSTTSVVDRLIERKTVFNEQEQAELSRRFLDVVFHQQISKDDVSARFNAFSYALMPRYEDRFRLTTASLLGLAAIALLLLLKFVIAPESRRNWAIAGAGTWLAAVAYIFVMFLGYRYISQSQTGLRLSSYVRYAHSMLLPVVLVCAAPLTPAFSARQVPGLRLGKLIFGRNAVAFATLITALLVFEPPYLKPLYTVQAAPSLRSEMQPVTEQLRANIGDARLWVFLPNDVQNGFIGRIFRFLLSPGYTYVEEDAAALLAEPEALKATLRNFDVLWFAVQNAEIDAAAEKIVGGPLATRVFRIDTTIDGIRFDPLPGAFDAGGHE